MLSDRVKYEYVGNCLMALVFFVILLVSYISSCPINISTHNNFACARRKSPISIGWSLFSALVADGLIYARLLYAFGTSYVFCALSREIISARCDVCTTHRCDTHQRRQHNNQTSCTAQIAV